MEDDSNYAVNVLEKVQNLKLNMQLLMARRLSIWN